MERKNLEGLVPQFCGATPQMEKRKLSLPPLRMNLEVKVSLKKRSEENVSIFRLKNF
jgi:hypothetical protein